MSFAGSQPSVVTPAVPQIPRPSSLNIEHEHPTQPISTAEGLAASDGGVFPGPVSPTAVIRDQYQEYDTERPLPRGRQSTAGTRHIHDWIVPIEQRRDSPIRPKTFGERLQPTLDTAIAERDRYAYKARMTGYLLNVAIGMQLLLGALTTGLSAVTSGRQTSITVSIFGGLSTLVASYLARSRSSGEPERSRARAKDLGQFVRECEAFKMDFGNKTGNEHDPQLEDLRQRLEDLLGNNTTG